MRIVLLLLNSKLKHIVGQTLLFVAAQTEGQVSPDVCASSKWT
jgi:hypothetical protein